MRGCIVSNEFNNPAARQDAVSASRSRVLLAPRCWKVIQSASVSRSWQDEAVEVVRTLPLTLYFSEGLSSCWVFLPCVGPARTARASQVLVTEDANRSRVAKVRCFPPSPRAWRVKVVAFGCEDSSPLGNGLGVGAALPQHRSVSGSRGRDHQDSRRAMLLKGFSRCTNNSGAVWFESSSSEQSVTCLRHSCLSFKNQILSIQQMSA